MDASSEDESEGCAASPGPRSKRQALDWRRCGGNSAAGSILSSHSSGGGGDRRRNPVAPVISIDSSDSGSVSGSGTVAGGKRRRKRPFRCRAKSFALTFSRCPVERDDFDAAFKLQRGPFPVYQSARELHKDGFPHLHVFIGYFKRRDVRSARSFDVAIDGTTYHPNFSKCRSEAAWQKYISKGDDHDLAPSLSGAAYDPLREELGKRKAMYADYCWSRDFLVTRSLKPVDFPVSLVCDGITYQLFAPDPAIKRRSWWIVAPPNAGKTRWLNRTFGGKRIYSPRTGKYPFEGYDDQDIVVYDDRESVSFAEFSSVLNTWDIVEPIAGEIRYNTKNWKLGHTRSVIVLSNHTIEESMKPEDVQRMRKRFIQIVNPILLQPSDLSSPEPEELQQSSEYQAFAS